MPATVLIAEDSAPVRRAVRSSIESSTDLTVCGEAEDGRVAVDMVRQLQPNIVILDIKMPVMNGLKAAAEILVASPRTEIIIFTFLDVSIVAQPANALGIHHIVSKMENPERLLKAIQAVAGKQITPLAEVEASNGREEDKGAVC